MPAVWFGCQPSLPILSPKERQRFQCLAWAAGICIALPAVLPVEMKCWHQETSCSDWTCSDRSPLLPCRGASIIMYERRQNVMHGGDVQKTPWHS